MDRRRRLGRKAPQHQRRSFWTAPQDDGLRARVVQRTQSGRVDQGSIGRQRAKMLANARERHRARTMIGHEPLGRIEKPLQVERRLH